MTDYQSTHESIHTPTHLSIHLSTQPRTHPSIQPSNTHMSTLSFIYGSACPFLCPSIYLYVHPPIILSILVCPFVSLLCPSIYQPQLSFFKIKNSLNTRQLVSDSFHTSYVHFLSPLSKHTLGISVLISLQMCVSFS